jgi:hypothetical protein
MNRLDQLRNRWRRLRRLRRFMRGKKIRGKPKPLNRVDFRELRERMNFFFELSGSE